MEEIKINLKVCTGLDPNELKELSPDLSENSTVFEKFKFGDAVQAKAKEKKKENKLKHKRGATNLKEKGLEKYLAP